MLDVRFIKENLEQVRTNLKKKNQGQKFKLLDEILTRYEQSLKLKQQAEELRHERNQLSERINKLVKEKQNASSIIKTVQGIPEKIKQLEEKKQHIDFGITTCLQQIPNIMHKDVPLGKNDTENKVTKKWGEIKEQKFEIKNHVEIGESLGILDFDASAKVSGNGFYYLK